MNEMPQLSYRSLAAGEGGYVTGLQIGMSLMNLLEAGRPSAECRAPVASAGGCTLHSGVQHTPERET